MHQKAMLLLRAGDTPFRARCRVATAVPTRKAFLVGTAVATRHLARKGVSPALSSNIAFWCIAFGLVGARLYYVVQSDWLWYLTHPQHIFAIWEGGMAFFGAI